MAFRAPEYERFEGQRASLPPWWPLWRATFRRGWKSKWIRWITIASFAPAAGFTLLIYALQEVLPGWRETMEEFGRSANFEEPLMLDASVYLWVLQTQIYMFLMPLSLLLGYDLLSGDIRSNALESYFSRPMTPFGYVFGRTLAFSGCLLLVTFVPMMWIWGLDVATSSAEHFERIKHVPLGLGAALGLVAVTMALFVQGLTSVTKNGTWTALVVAALFVLSGMLGPMLYFGASNSTQPALMAVAFWENIFVIANGFLDYPESVRDHAPFPVSFGVISGVFLISFLYLMRRVKRGGLVG